MMIMSMIARTKPSHIIIAMIFNFLAIREAIAASVNLPAANSESTYQYIHVQVHIVSLIIVTINE